MGHISGYLIRCPRGNTLCIALQFQSGTAIGRPSSSLTPLCSRGISTFRRPRRPNFSTRQASIAPSSLSLSYKPRMKAYLECISAPTVDTNGASFLLLIDGKRYIFGNIHEGFQRAALEHGAKFSRVSEIFLTGKTEWKATGGLIGCILTVADTVQTSNLALKETLNKARENNARKNGAVSKEGGQPSQKKQASSESPKLPRLGLHGGPNITQTIATARRFIFRQGLPLDVHEPTSASSKGGIDPTWEDDLLRVWAMPISPHETGFERTSPLKRTFGDLVNDEIQHSTTAGKDSAHKAEDDKVEVAQKIVRDMFESNWRLDALFETRLRELQLPATVFVRDPQTKGIERYRGKIAANPAERPDIDVLARKPWPGALVATLPKTQPSNVSMSYICRTHIQRGKFLPEKAKALSIPKGDLYRRLAEGETIELADGTVVKPEQVLGSPRPSSGFMFSELPSIAYLDHFISRPELQHESTMKNVKMMAWILGPGVVEDSRFQQFVQRHTDAEHIIASSDYSANQLVFDSASAAAIRHADIDPHRYEYPSFNNARKPLPDDLAKCHVAERGLAVHLEPAFKLDKDTIVRPLNTANVWESMPKQARELGIQAQNEVQSADFKQLVDQQNLPGGNNEIITIGTGSALPSKYRNVSATILRVPGIGSYLFDCGENTLGQLSRLYNPEELDKLLRDLKMIWISHLHADHHLGTTAIIKAWHDATQDRNKAAATSSPGAPEAKSDVLETQGRLLIASDNAMIQWLREYAEVEDFGINKLSLLEVGTVNGVTSVRWNGREAGTKSNDVPAIKAFKAASGLAAFEACYVPHCKGAQGVALTFPDGFKVTYSGDTRPARSLVEIGRNSTVLIHEATFEDEKAGDAAAKNHSTTSEAINVGREMNAQRIILTHFSQRYTKIPVMSDLAPRQVELIDAEDVDPEAPDVVQDAESTQVVVAEGAASPRSRSPQSLSRPGSRASSQKRGPLVAVAFDGMRVKVKDIMALELFNPALMSLYEGANDRLVLTEAEKAEKQAKARQEKTERKASQRAKRDRERASRPGSSRSQRSHEGVEAAS